MDEHGEVTYLEPQTSGKEKVQIHRFFPDGATASLKKTLVYGRQLLMKNDKNEVVVIRDPTILIVDKAKFLDNKPCPKYKGSRYAGIIDAILTKNSRIMFFLTAKGRIESIDLKRTSNGNSIRLENSKSHSESQNSEENRDSNESTKRSQYCALRLSSDDKTLAVISYDKSGSLTVQLLLVDYPNLDFHSPAITSSDRMDIPLNGLNISSLCVQYMNFDIKKGDTHYLIVFLRTPIVLFVAAVVNGRIEGEVQRQEIQRQIAISKPYLNDAVRVENTIFIALHSTHVLKISLKE
jgi:hypothetical protein